MSKILSNSLQIQTAIKSIKPTIIAVAYIGIDWEKYIDSKLIDKIVISPTMGSNPNAIDALVNSIGFENVYFLDNLHTKAYVGETGAVVASANLTSNGLGAAGLFEMGVQVNTEDNHIDDIRDEIACYFEKSKKAYPTTKRKKEKLAELRMIWGKSVSMGLINSNMKSPSLEDYCCQDDIPFHVVSYNCDGDDSVRDDKKIESAVSEAKGKDIDELYIHQFHFLNDDEINDGDWVLAWEAEDDNYPSKENDSVYWVYAHNVVPNVWIDSEESHTKFVGQRKGITTPEPFEIDGNARDAIIKTLEMSKFSDLRAKNGGEYWQLKNSKQHVKAFIEEIKNQLV